MQKDPWKERKNHMLCLCCMWYVKKEASVKPSWSVGRCRRHAPTMEGYPVVFPDDWCGDHKLNENKADYITED